MSISRAVAALCLCTAASFFLIRSVPAQEGPPRDDRVKETPKTPGPRDRGEPDLRAKPSKSMGGPGMYPFDKPDDNRRPPGRGGSGRPAWPGLPSPGAEVPQFPGPMSPGMVPQSPMGPRFLFGLRDPRQLEELKRLDPEMYELEKADQDLERQTSDLAQQYRRAPRQEREALKGKLKEVIEKHFQVRQSRRELHLKRLQEELEKLKQTIDRRNEVRKEIVERRIRELIGEQSDLDF